VVQKLKVERQSYADFTEMPYSRERYTQVHGLVNAYGGRVLDVKFVIEQHKLILFYEMPKTAREEFDKEMTKGRLDY
jgi:hypothetical protein